MVTKRSKRREWFKNRTRGEEEILSSEQERTKKDITVNVGYYFRNNKSSAEG